MKGPINRLLSIMLTVCLLLSFQAFAATNTASASQASQTQSMLPTPYTIEYDKYYSLYAGYPNTMTHYLVYDRIAANHKEGAKYTVIEELNKLPKLQEVTVSKNNRVMMDMLLIGMDGAKRQMYITQNALHIGGKSYRLSDEQYYRLLTVIDDALYDGTPYARWLVYMSPRKITKIVCTDEKGRTFEVKESNLIAAANFTKNIPVSYGRRYDAGTYDFSKVKNMFKAAIQFDDNLVYNLYFTNTELYIESNGINYGCRYTMEFRDQIGEYFKEAEKGTPKAKAPVKPESGSKNTSSSAKSK